MNSYRCCTSSSKEAVNIKEVAFLLKLVGEESRLKILCVLSQKDHCVCELMEHTKYSQSLISHHLKDLKDAGLVSSHKKGLRVYYALNPQGKIVIDSLLQIHNKS